MGEREGGKEGENKRQKSLKLNCSISNGNTFDLKDCATIMHMYPPLKCRTSETRELLLS